MNFSSAGSADPEGGTLTYAWAFGDGTTSTAANPTKTYTADGSYTATLTVRDPQGATGTQQRDGHRRQHRPDGHDQQPGRRPAVLLRRHACRSAHRHRPRGRHDRLRQGQDDLRARARPARPPDHLGNGCSGTITIPVDGEHDDAANIFAVFDAEYTDAGGLTTHTQYTLQPRHRQAEHYKTSSGIATFDKAPAEGGKTVGDIENGDWIGFTPYRLGNVTSFTARVSSAGAGGTVQIRAGSPTGTLLGQATVPVTGGWDDLHHGHRHGRPAHRPAPPRST